MQHHEQNYIGFKTTFPISIYMKVLFWRIFQRQIIRNAGERLDIMHGIRMHTGRFEVSVYILCVRLPTVQPSSWVLGKLGSVMQNATS